MNIYDLGVKIHSYHTVTQRHYQTCHSWSAWYPANCATMLRASSVYLCLTISRSIFFFLLRRGEGFLLFLFVCLWGHAFTWHRSKTKSVKKVRGRAGGHPENKGQFEEKVSHRITLADHTTKINTPRWIVLTWTVTVQCHQISSRPPVPMAFTRKEILNKVYTNTGKRLPSRNSWELCTKNRFPIHEAKQRVAYMPYLCVVLVACLWSSSLPVPNFGQTLLPKLIVSKRKTFQLGRISVEVLKRYAQVKKTEILFKRQFEQSFTFRINYNW